MYTTFSKDPRNPIYNNMFFDGNVNVSRYDKQRYPIFEKLIEKQLSFFWRPEEVDLSQDRKDFEQMPEHEKHIFVSNLKYQILLDSIQGRSPNVAFLTLVSIPELETWIQTWSFSETIHSRSYTHILRNVFTDPSPIFDSIIKDTEIVKRAEPLTKYYDDLITYKTKLEAMDHDFGNVSLKATEEIYKKLFLALVAVNVLEAIRFYVSFACSFAFAERTKMEGNAKIIKLIARDEALHLTGTQHIINNILKGYEGEFFQKIAHNCRPEMLEIFRSAVEQEKEWANYLFKDGSMIGLNATILQQYVEYITNTRMQAIGLIPEYATVNNPLPWINSWLASDNVQVAPQETEISSYLVGQIDSSVDTSDLGSFDL